MTLFCLDLLTFRINFNLFSNQPFLIAICVLELCRSLFYALRFPMFGSRSPIIFNKEMSFLELRFPTSGYEGFYDIWIAEVGNISIRIAEIRKLTSLLVKYLLRDLRKMENFGFVKVVWCFLDFQFLTVRLSDIDNIAFDL